MKEGRRGERKVEREGGKQERKGGRKGKYFCCEFDFFISV